MEQLVTSAEAAVEEVVRRGVSFSTFVHGALHTYSIFDFFPMLFMN